ncbi:MAG: hypothetical protein JJU00_10390 [Opitutales bacterium]|nr:hypothetical protein [Opitutales bacterium]
MPTVQREFFAYTESVAPESPEAAFIEKIRRFDGFDQTSAETVLPCETRAPVPILTNEFWTSKQRAGHPLHEVSYRACFKPQLPRFFIARLTAPGDLVYDPFMGRGTTLLEAALLDRAVAGCDISPLGAVLTGPRLAPPTPVAIERRLGEIDWTTAEPEDLREDLLVFYHPDTLRALGALRRHLRAQGTLDPVDNWIRMIATNRLSGHSPGFFSVYSLPPNQAVSIDRQRKINAKRNQTPPPRDVPAIILKKSRQLLKTVSAEDRRRLHAAAATARLLTRSCDETPEIASGTVQLVVTSPPFLGIVDYKYDNWLRCWFNNIDAKTVPVWQFNRPKQWEEAMSRVFTELWRILRPGGWVAFEVGEVLKGTVNLEEIVVPLAESAGFVPVLVMVNQQEFTKTANCWGVNNNKGGTNTNRIAVLRKPEGRAKRR